MITSRTSPSGSSCSPRPRLRGAALEAILTSVHASTAQVGAIAHAAQAMAASAQQVIDAMHAISAAVDLIATAEQLKHQAGRFRTRADGLLADGQGEDRLPLAA